MWCVWWRVVVAVVAAAVVVVVVVDVIIEVFAVVIDALLIVIAGVLRLKRLCWLNETIGETDKRRFDDCWRFIDRDAADDARATGVLALEIAAGDDDVSFGSL